MLAPTPVLQWTPLLASLIVLGLVSTRVFPLAPPLAPQALGQMHLDAATGEHVGPQRLDELPGGHLERRAMRMRECTFIICRPAS